MTEPKAWHCPNCNAYHAPHVDTCPNPVKAAITAPTAQRISEPFIHNPPNVYGQGQNTAAMNPEYIQRIIRANGAQSGTVPL